MTAVLAAREHWCRPGERILWLRKGELKDLPHDVAGLDARGRPRKGLATRALKAVGKGAAFAVAAPLAVAAEAMSEIPDERDVPIPRFHPWVVGPGPDCVAATTIRPWHGRSLPGWEDVPGYWVLTPARLAWLTTPEALAKLAKGEKGFMGNMAHLAGGIAADIAVGTFEMITKSPAGKPVELPELVSGFEFDQAQIASIQPVWRDQKTPVLRATLAADGSGFDFPLSGPHDPMLRFTNGS